MATVAELREAAGFSRVDAGGAGGDGGAGGAGRAGRADDEGRAVESVYCCDLLSVVMGKAPAGCAWVTVMGNINVVAVAALVDAACVVVADGAAIEPRAVEKAAEQGVVLMRSTLPVFEAAMRAYEAIG